MMSKVKDQRKSKRYQCYVPVEGKEGTSFSSFRTVDISRDGIGFISDQPIPVDEKIAVEIALTPDSDPVLVMGVVKWVRKITDADQFRIGMTFSDVLSGSRRGLGRHLKTDLDDVSADFDDLPEE